MNNDIQIGSLGEQMTDTIIKMIINDTYPVYRKVKEWGKDTIHYLRFEIGEPKSCLINQDTGEIVERKKFMAELLKKYPDYIEKYLNYYETGFE